METDTENKNIPKAHDKVVDLCVRCADCKFWDDIEYEYELTGARPCQMTSGHFFIGGGHNTDRLFTESVFGCIDGIKRI